jgi:hypothetical protein
MLSLRTVALALCITEEAPMLRIHAPILIVPTAEVREAVGPHLQAAGVAAYREIAGAAKGLEIAHLQFIFRRLTLAVCSRVRRDGLIEIELGIGNPRLPTAQFTAAEMRRAEAATRVRVASPSRRSPGRGS